MSDKLCEHTLLIFYPEEERETVEDLLNEIMDTVFNRLNGHYSVTAVTSYDAEKR